MGPSFGLPTMHHPPIQPGPAIGIDSGSVALKAAGMVGEELLLTLIEPTGAHPARQCRRLITAVREALPGGGDAPVVATGYGREVIEDADRTVSEIFANALGAGWAWRHWNGGDGDVRPDRFRTIIDIGGQDSKVITFTGDGVLEGFAMNDRCAAGTGRFLQELAVVLELDGIDQLSELAARTPCCGSISSTCTVFAESEVISLIAAGRPRSAIAGGIFHAVAARVRELAEGLQWQPPVLFDGGAANLRAMRTALERSLDAPVSVPDRPQHITAIGAALLAVQPDGD